MVCRVSNAVRLRLAACLLAAAAGCSPPPVRDPAPEPVPIEHTAVISGRVVTNTSNFLLPGGVQMAGIPGADVRVFRVAAGEIPAPGDYVCLRENVASGRSALEPFEGDVRCLASAAPGDSGAVLHLAERTISGAARTDSLGRFRVVVPASGRYLVAASAEGFRQVLVPASATASDTTLTIELPAVFIPQLPLLRVPRR